MADQVEIRLPKTVVEELTNMTVTVNFRTRATGAASIPTTIRYRIDNLEGRKPIRGWTAVNAAAEVTILLVSSDNAILSSNRRRERRQIIVEADAGLSTQAIGSAQWRVKNLYGIGR